MHVDCRPLKRIRINLPMPWRSLGHIWALAKSQEGFVALLSIVGPGSASVLSDLGGLQ